MGCGPSISQLPDEIITHIVSFTSPADVCRFAAASSIFRTAASCDHVWEGFLPDNYHNILDQTNCTMVFTSKRQLYFHFCLPLYLPDDKVYFWLEKSSGKKCYRLCPEKFTASVSTRYFARPHGNHQSGPSLPSLGIKYFIAEAEFDTRRLSPETTYVAYLLVDSFLNSKIIDTLYYPPAELAVKLGDNVVSARIGCVRVPPANITGAAARCFLVPRSGSLMELELGLFYVEDKEEGALQLALSEMVEPELGTEMRDIMEQGEWLEDVGLAMARGLIIDGFEIRPYVKPTYEWKRPQLRQPFGKWYEPTRFV